ncbi:phBC6A51 family helix-turn-helix protein [Cytobacillus sp. NJ13]|nr:phBC6A51 family helix-turn-helix protein [Cytobacillus sp. NJ13]
MENNEFRELQLQRKDEVRELLVITLEGREIDLQNLPEPKTNNTRKLTHNQRKLALLQATAPYHNMSFTEQCDLVGISRTAGYKIIKKQNFQEYVEELLEFQNRQFMGTVFKTLEDLILKSRSEKIKLDAVKVYLTMTGKLSESKTVTHEIKQLESQEERERRIIEMEHELLEIDGDLSE